MDENLVVTDELLANTDSLFVGGSGDDSLVGTDSDDVINGLAGNDTIDGFAGNDTIDGGEGQNFLSGGNGNDLIVGGNSNDFVGGGAGNDTIDGSSFSDLISGEEGQDTFILNSDSSDTILDFDINQSDRLVLPEGVTADDLVVIKGDRTRSTTLGISPDTEGSDGGTIAVFDGGIGFVSDGSFAQNSIDSTITLEEFQANG